LFVFFLLIAQNHVLSSVHFICFFNWNRILSIAWNY